MAGIRESKSKSKPGKREKAALRRLERSRVRQARTENRVMELRQRLARAEAKLARRAARLAEAEAAVKSVAAPKREKVHARKGAATGGKAAKARSASRERAVVAGVTTPQETIEDLAALSEAPPAPVADGAATPEQAADELAVTAQEPRNGARPARSRSRRTTTSGAS